MIDDIIIPLSEEEVIMRTNAEIICHLANALGNVETGPDSVQITEQLLNHAKVIQKYSEKLIQSQRIDISLVK